MMMTEVSSILNGVLVNNTLPPTKGNKMMTKWDTIQSDLEPVTPYYWDMEEESEELSLDELLEEENEIVLDWEQYE